MRTIGRTGFCVICRRIWGWTSGGRPITSPIRSRCREETVYTIHAAKAVARSDGKMTLHDVGIVLYGRSRTGQTGSTGNEFEYDQKNEIIRAVGEVHIDRQAPEAADANAKMDYAAERICRVASPGSMRARTTV